MGNVARGDWSSVDNKEGYWGGLEGTDELIFVVKGFVDKIRSCARVDEGIRGNKSGVGCMCSLLEGDWDYKWVRW